MGFACRCPGEEGGHTALFAHSRYKILPHRLIWNFLIHQWMVWTTVSLMQESENWKNQALCGLCGGPAWFLHLCKRVLWMAEGTLVCLLQLLPQAFLCVSQLMKTLWTRCQRVPGRGFAHWWFTALARAKWEVRQPPPTMSQINPWGYIISVNRITGLDMKLCLCSHQCCQFLHCKVGKVTHVGVWRLTDSGVWRTAVAVFLKAQSWAWYI